MVIEISNTITSILAMIASFLIVVIIFREYWKYKELAGLLLLLIYGGFFLFTLTNFVISLLVFLGIDRNQINTIFFTGISLINIGILAISVLYAFVRNGRIKS